MASSQKDMEPQGRESDAPVRTRRRSGTLGLRKTTLESRVHVQTVGLNAKKIISALSQGKTFLLTFPFIGPLRQSRHWQRPAGPSPKYSEGSGEARCTAFPNRQAVETELCAAHLKKQAQMYVEVNAPPEQASRDALTSLGQMLMISNEFLYVQENL